MNVMICFEVSDKQEQVRNSLTSKGYLSSWRITRGHDEITYNLPSTSMWKKGDNMSPAKAKEDLKNACKESKVKMVRVMAMVIGKWDGITGDNHNAESSVSEQAAEA